MSTSAYQIQWVQEGFAKMEPIADQAVGIFYTTLFGYGPSLKRLVQSYMKSQGQTLMATLKKGPDDAWTPELCQTWLVTVCLVSKVMKQHAYLDYKSPF